jgi:electron transfer DM13
MNARLRGDGQIASIRRDVFPPPPAAEQLTEADRSPLHATGTFIHASPSDPVHWGRGTVSVYERAVFLEPDFEVGPGPKYHVYLVPNASVRKEEQVTNSMFVDLGRLRAFKGSQRYPIPADLNLKGYASVIIWCEQFGVLISPADLTAAAR